MPETITEDGEIITTPATAEQMSLAIGLTRAEIDQQIATAHAFPRSVSRVTQSVLSLVTIDEQSAEECNYALPRGGKSITGPSIRLAEIVAGQWGNCRVGARVVHVDRAEKYVEAEGVFHDLETNTATTARVRRRISDKHGRLLAEDMIIVTGNAASSIAKRNAILGGVPKAVWRKAHDAALQTIKGTVKTLTERREKVLKAFAAFGVKPEQIFAVLEVGGLDDITLEHIPILTGMHSALKNAEATVEDMFGTSASTGTAALQGGGKKGLAGKLSDVADGGKSATEGKGGAGAAPDKKNKKPDADQGSADQNDGKIDNLAEQSGAGNEQEDDFPGDRPSGASQQQDRSQANAEPTGDDIENAKDRGSEAYHTGMSRKTLPAEYRESAPLAEAWRVGFDAAKEDEEKSGGAE